MDRAQKILTFAALSSLAAPAFAGVTVVTPAPVAGVGVGAVVLVGFAYRALKRRIGG